MKILNGYAGCGKTYKLIDDIKSLSSLIEDDKILILTANTYKKNEIASIFINQNFSIKTFNSFFHNLFKKIPKSFNSEIILIILFSLL